MSEQGGLFQDSRRVFPWGLSPIPEVPSELASEASSSYDEEDDDTLLTLQEVCFDAEDGLSSHDMGGLTSYDEPSGTWEDLTHLLGRESNLSNAEEEKFEGSCTPWDSVSSSSSSSAPGSPRKGKAFLRLLRLLEERQVNECMTQDPIQSSHKEEEREEIIISDSLEEEKTFEDLLSDISSQACRLRHDLSSGSTQKAPGIPRRRRKRRRGNDKSAHEENDIVSSSMSLNDASRHSRLFKLIQGPLESDEEEALSLSESSVLEEENSFWRRSLQFQIELQELEVLPPPSVTLVPSLLPT